jgi:hypothetical protein
MKSFWQLGKIAGKSISMHATFFILMGMTALPAFATDHFNLESGIPTTIEDIEPIERGGVEFQAFGRYLRLIGGKNVGEVEPRLALGIFDKTQLEIATPLFFGEDEGNGNGDVQISILRKLWDDSREEWWPGFAIEADVRLPTGIERHGFKNRFDAGVTALMKKDVGDHSFHFNAGFDWSDDESEEETLRRGIWSITVGHHTALTQWLVLVSDLLWRQADEKQTKDIWLLETGVRAQLTPKLIGAIGIGAGLNRGADTPILALTVGFQFGL